MIANPSSLLESELQRLTARTLSPASRYGHVALLLAALIMSVLIGALLATEPTLPPRTQTAFAAMLAIGISWVAYATWVLTQRRPLMAMHRVIAAWMAVAFTGMFLGGAWMMAPPIPKSAYFTAVVGGGCLFVLAMTMLVQAYRRVSALRVRKRELEAALRADGVRFTSRAK